MEKRCYSRMMLGQFWLSVRTSFVAVTKLAIDIQVMPWGGASAACDQSR
jgi:hypothetical protein